MWATGTARLMWPIAHGGRYFGDQLAVLIDSGFAAAHALVFGVVRVNVFDRPEDRSQNKPSRSGFWVR